VDEHTFVVWNCDERPCEPSASGTLTAPKKSDRGSKATSDSTVERSGHPTLEQVHVTGKRTPLETYTAEASLEELVVSKEEIDRSGALTLPGAMLFSTQFFNGGVTEGNIRSGREANTNNNHATGVNVRGVGAADTLILLDGHRTVAGGTDAMYTESDMFPLEGLLRVQVLLDGPPLRYGGDTIGGVINVVMNKQFTGFNTELQGAGFGGDARHEYRVGHMEGWSWGDTHFEFAIEMRQQSDLLASERAQYTNDLSRFGGTDFRTPYSQPGTLLAGSQLYAIPPNLGGNPSVPANWVAKPNLTDQLADTDIFPQQRRWNGYLEIDHNLGEGLTVSAEALCSYRQVTDRVGAYTAAITVNTTDAFYFNPTGGTEPVNVLYKFTHELGSAVERTGVTTCDSTLSLDKELGGWRFNGSLGYGVENQNQTVDGLVDFALLAGALTGPKNTAFDPFGDGTQANTATVDLFRSSSHYSSSNDQWDLQLTADGPLFSLLRRDVNLGLGTEFRKETLDSRTKQSISLPETATNLGRTITSAFGEIKIPMPGHATFAASGRVDRYSDFGTVFSPEYVLTVVPSRSFSIRATWAKLYRPPNITQLIESNNVSRILPLPDTQSIAGASTVLIDTGENSQLKEEHSRNWSVRAEFKPEALTGFRSGANYFHIDSRNLIEDLLFQPDVLNNPAYRSTVNRNPTAAQRQAICSHGHFDGSPDSCLSTPIDAIVDLRTRNTAILTTSGVDFEAAYVWQPGWGELEADLRGTYIFDFSEAATADSPKIQLRNTPDNPVDLRLRPMAQWRFGGLATAVSVNYWNHYRDTVSIPNRNVPSWTTVDMQVSYTIDGLNRSVLDGTQIFLTATNLFDRDPPFVNGPLGVGYDLVNGNLGGRIVGVMIRKQW
jgi:outer membrane receptor protein involved in Fe transport